MKKRIYPIDEYRGFVLILMIIYHTLFDLQVIFGQDIFIYRSNLYRYIVWFIGSSFILISGISSNLSKNIQKRGIICGVIAMGMTLATYIFTPELTILFGILHFMAVAMLIAPYIKKFTDKINPVLGITICLALFFLTFHISSGYLGIKPFFSWDIPPSITNLSFLFPLGICSPTFSSGDYYPLLPWIFIYAIGVILGEKIVEARLPEFCYRVRFRFLAFIGRRTMLFYVLHQPIIYGVLCLIYG